MTGLGLTETKPNFNPRSREGSDTNSIYQYQDRMISIHAPVKGATTAKLSVSMMCLYFNPRSREGSDPSICFFLT